MKSLAAHSHVVEIDEAQRMLTIYRTSDGARQLYTSVKLPADQDPDGLKSFCQMLGENILFDSPQARRLLGI